MAGALIGLFLAAATWVAVLYGQHGSLLLRCGTLAPGKLFLDGSQNWFQQISWRMGNGLRTRGVTYGVKVGHAFVTVQVTRVDPRWTRAEAREDD